MEDQNSFEDAICDYYYSSLVACWGRELVCNGDIPAVEPCGTQAAEVADCVARRGDECGGFCWAAEALGCGSADCITACHTKADETSCGSYYRSMLECTYDNRALQMTCENGEPTPSSECDAATMQYTTCVASM